jgi:hypothetical protein
VQNRTISRKYFTARLLALRALSDHDPLCTFLDPSLLDLYLCVKTLFYIIYLYKI